jgi:hypothetical protein
MGWTMDIVDAIVGVVAVDHTVIDLSPAGAVRIGDYASADISGAFAAVMPGGTGNDEPVSLQDWGARQSVSILVLCPAASQDPADRIRAAANAHDAIMETLWAAMIETPLAAFVGVVFNQTVETDILDGSQYGPTWGGWGVVVIRIGYSVAIQAGTVP